MQDPVRPRSVPGFVTASCRDDARRANEAWLGRCAATLVHELRNLLVPVLGHAELALAELPPGHPAHRHVRQLAKGATRARRLAVAALGAVRPPAEPAVVDLATVVGEAIELLRCARAGRRTLVLRQRAADTAVFADEGQLHQVVLNLGGNALEALGHDDGLVEFVVERAVGPDGCGEGVRLRVRDEGPGLPAEVRSQLCEPFVAVGRRAGATGLGLATSRTIVAAHGGLLRAVDEGPGGAVLEVLLPAASTAPVEVVSGGAARRVLVLTVGDPAVRAVAARLAALGADVSSVVDRSVALAVLRRDPGGYDAVVAGDDGADPEGLHWLAEALALAPHLAGLAVDTAPSRRGTDGAVLRLTPAQIAADEHLCERLRRRGGGQLPTIGPTRLA